MAGDAGTIVWSVPTNGQATEAANVAGTVSAGVKAAFVAQQPMDVYEVGAVIGTATAATTFVFTVAIDEKVGGTLSSTSVSPSNFATVTGPAATIIPAGTTLKKSVKMRVPKGGCLVFTVTGAPASGTAQYYAIVSPAGAPAIGQQAGAGGLGLTLVSGIPVVNELISTT